MTSLEIEGLRNWGFLDLYNKNKIYYVNIYQGILLSIRQKIYRDPSIEDMEDALAAALLSDSHFIAYCESKNSYNPDWNTHCTRQFAKYIVFDLYGKGMRDGTGASTPF